MEPKVWQYSKSISAACNFNIHITPNFRSTLISLALLSGFLSHMKKMFPPPFVRKIFWWPYGRNVPLVLQKNMSWRHGTNVPPCYNVTVFWATWQECSCLTIKMLSQPRGMNGPLVFRKKLNCATWQRSYILVSNVSGYSAHGRYMDA